MDTIHKVRALSIDAGSQMPLLVYIVTNVTLVLIFIMFFLLFVYIKEPDRLDCLKYETIGAVRNT